MDINNLSTIPLNNLKEFIIKNNYIIPTRQEEIYNLVIDIIDSGDYSYITNDIIDWVKARDLRHLPLPTYKSSEIILSPYPNLFDLSKTLNLTIPDKDRILRILTYLNKLDNDISIFEVLPVDMIKNILKNLDCKSTILMCKLSTKLSKICQQENMLELILKDKFTKIGYEVKSFSLDMLQHMCSVLNRQHPTMTSYGDKLYVLKDNYINVITFNNDLESLIEIEVAFEVVDVIQIVYYHPNKLLLLNNNGTIDYILLDNYKKYKITNISNIIYILPNTNKAISADGSNFKFDITGNMWDVLNNNTIDESNDDLELKANGTVYYEGKMLQDLNDIIDISSGNGHNLALRSDGRIYSWGNNNYGQLGIENESNYPVLVPGLDNIIKVLAGDGISLVLTNDGNIYRFGRGFDTYDFNPVLIDDIVNGIELYQNRNYVDYDSASIDLDAEDPEILYNFDRINYNFQFVKTINNIYYVLIGNIITSFKL